MRIQNVLQVSQSMQGVLGRSFMLLREHSEDRKGACGRRKIKWKFLADEEEWGYVAEWV